MKQLNPACSRPYFRRFFLFFIFLSAVTMAFGQCPVPYPVGDLDSTTRNTPVATVVTRNDATSFSNNSPLIPDTLYVVGQPSHGTVTVLNDSTIRYTPGAGYVGTDFYTYRVCNACGNCANATVVINVTATCPKPVAAADVYTVYNNVPNTLNVTSNDANTVGGPLTVTVTHVPAHGTASVSGANIVYTGNGSYTGPDTLVYMICDTCPGASCDTAYVYLTVTSCLHVSAVNDTATVEQGQTASLNVLSNDVNATGYGTPVVTLLSGSHFGSTATLTGGQIVYVAGTLGLGRDSLRYQVCTNCGCDTAYAIFTVTPAPCLRPTALADNEYAGYSSTCSSTYNILANDILPINGGTLTVTISLPPTFGTASIVNNKLVYTCTDSTKIGQTDLVKYSVCNACYCDTGVVAIHITSYICNGRNPIINKDTAYVCKNFPVTFNVTGNDVDPEGTVVSIDTIVGAAQHGTARKVNNNDVSYTPAANFSGHDYFVYQACDNGTPKLCNIATVDVFVLDCNAPPVILGASGAPTDTIHLTVYEDSFTNYCFHYTEADSPYVFISSIGASLDTVTPSAGSTSPGTQPCIHISALTNSTAQQTVQVIICSENPTCDTVSVIISVIPINHAPTAQPDHFAYTGPGCTSVNVLLNDYDTDAGDHLTITHFDSVTVHGTVTQVGDSMLCYMPDSNFAGIDTFAYTICDTSHLCATSYVVVTVGIVARNDQASTMQDQSVNINVQANDSHTPQQFVTLCSIPVHGTAVVDSAGVTYTPVHDYPIDPASTDTTMVMGLDSFCYTLCSVFGTDTTCASAEVYVSIAPKGRLYIPQGISPNGDGINDKFVIASVDEYPLSQLLVYNRYGDEVWRNDDVGGYQNDFDGTWKKNGQPLPDMSYWYIFKFNDGIHQDRMGYIVIER